MIDPTKSIDTINKNDFVSSIKSTEYIKFKSYCVINLRTGKKKSYVHVEKSDDHGEHNE